MTASATYFDPYTGHIIVSTPQMTVLSEIEDRNIA
jgi:hypothetical protein